jgi:multidrug efflux pump
MPGPEEPTPMKISDISIRRPIFASMVSLALVLFGAIGYSRLSVREYPDVDPPIVSVTTVLPGANPQVVESAVTDILEEELSTVEGLRTLTSGSQEQVSNITLEFNLDRDVEAAAQDVRDKVSRVRDRLPEDVEEPVVAKQEADANPFFWLALSGENYDLLQLSDIGDRMVKSRLQTLPGVGQARIFGERRFSMRVWLGASALASRGLTVQDVEDAIRSRNVEIPGGRIESERREFTVRSLGELKTPAEFSELVVSNDSGQLVKLKDIGRVELGPEDERSVLRFNRRPAVAIGVIRQSKANIIEVADAIHAELPEIQRSLPAGVRIDAAFDQSVFVKRSILEAQETLLLAGGLVVVIIFLFLRNLRATIIPGLAIPASIIATFAVMYFLGFSINNLTLLALTLAIGIVVDDAIIVLENAYRHQEELGEDPVTAAREGTREIGFAVVATTICLIAVFTPLAFLKGSTGRLFNEFGIAVAGSVAVSGLVALTLTPMLCAQILRVPHSHGKVYRSLERGFDAMATGYAWLLDRALRLRWAVVVGALALLVGAGFVFKTLKREFIPPEDRGWFISFLIAPEGSSLSYTDGYQQQAEAILAKTEGIESFFSIVNIGDGVSRGIIFTNLDDWSKRTRKVGEIVGEVQGQFFGIPGVFAFANNPPAFGWGSPVQYVVQHSDFAQLAKAADTLTVRARAIKGLLNVDTDLRVNKPELTVTFDRDRAEDLGVPVRDVAATLQTMLGGREVSTFTRANKLYDVIVQLSPEARATPSDMTGLYVRGRNDELIKLDAVANISEGVGPRELNHFQRVRSFTLTAGLAPGFTLGEALDSLNRVAAEVLPRGSTTALAGESRELEESSGALYFAFVLALIVVFMVLASQFESLVHPFTVLLAVPLAVTGALFTLLLARSTINLYSQIGMILLIGLVTKNSILLVEYANQLKERGLETLAAVREAGRIRLRPILMTSVCTIMGALPIALGLGAGAASRRPLGYAIVGGVLVSTVLTLFLVPVVYVLFDRATARVRARRPALTPAPATAEAE